MPHFTKAKQAAQEMSQPRKFTVHAWCDKPFFSRIEIEAESAAQALIIAKEQINDADAEACDDGFPWDTFSVDDDTEEKENVLSEGPQPKAI